MIRRGSHVKSVDKPAYMVILYSSMLLEPDRPSREAVCPSYLLPPESRCTCPNGSSKAHHFQIVLPACAIPPPPAGVLADRMSRSQFRMSQTLRSPGQLGAMIHLSSRRTGFDVRCLQQAVFYKDLVATLVKRVPDVISIYDCRCELWMTPSLTCTLAAL